ncbi:MULTISPECIES: GNAT family N-acetyltransferase [Tatumella]|uniref:GNAT family N-acetyltransferase n=1 Tax=Tatumella punctata TaxID=399969 RepID=A0ABW1VKQ5_9GAMM|nr:MULTISPECIES: GNAT family protein [unclassified Tatumella]MBS0854847.1 GNAT family N-acetyltransferase [Tatumella sp. JGM16]MBS0893003.1 GNAT family N-acetyltransferase [Tatumella sp. JGM130]MBS0912191.1 GNAT family N-acetyltransferase [Tatumella sp. JGM91]
MTDRINKFGQPIGLPVDTWQPAKLPEAVTLTGHYCQLQPLDSQRHEQDLCQALQCETGGESLWTYMFSGPFTSRQHFHEYIRAAANSRDPFHFAVIDNATGKATGSLSLMRIDTANGVAEAGHVMFSPQLQRTPLSTEAQYLLMRYAFDTLGYRRYEWKCDSLNTPSRNAALRLGFRFEGIFRQAMVYKGRNRDTAWFSVTDEEWPGLRSAFTQWLSADNFDSAGQQRYPLRYFRSGTL